MLHCRTLREMSRPATGGRARSLVARTLVVLATVSLAAACPSAARAANGNDWVKQASRKFKVGGKDFRFAGSNNYYLMYKSPFMVDDVLNAAATAGFTVMRTRASIDIGNQDGSNSIPGGGKADGGGVSVYFQFLNGAAPAYNDGTDGLQRLDYMIFKAGQLGIRLIIPFVNNWQDFGGIDQYVAWRGGQHHDDFYTDATIRQWFKNWISHLLNRVNSYTGVAYKDDPTIMAWELANEPRCGGSGLYPASAGCNTQTLVTWANEMSHHFKTVNAHQLLAVGDEGFYCDDPTSSDFTINCSQGVDTKALASLPQIDYMSFHLYPEQWGKDVAFGTQWITRHFADAASINKPGLLGEYGLTDAAHRNPNYKLWTDAVFQSGGNGALYWILSGKQDNGTLYPDFDMYTVYCPSPVCTTESHFAAMMTSGQALSFSPVADGDTATTSFATAVTLTPLANDITYGGATMVGSSIDLDPVAVGQQTTLALPGGTFAAAADGSVAFTPASGFSGVVVASYLAEDSFGRASNVAPLTVTVKPDQGAPLILNSFETGVEGWGPASFESPVPGTVQQSAVFHTDGSFSLEVDANSSSGAWWGVSYATPLDLTGKTHLLWDVQTTMGTSQELAIQSGDDFSFCQGPFAQYYNAGTSTTIDKDSEPALLHARPLQGARHLHLHGQRQPSRSDLHRQHPGRRPAPDPPPLVRDECGGLGARQLREPGAGDRAAERRLPHRRQLRPGGRRQQQQRRLVGRLLRDAPRSEREDPHPVGRRHDDGHRAGAGRPVGRQLQLLSGPVRAVLQRRHRHHDRQGPHPALLHARPLQGARHLHLHGQRQPPRPDLHRPDRRPVTTRGPGAGTPRRYGNEAKKSQTARLASKQTVDVLEQVKPVLTGQACPSSCEHMTTGSPAAQP